MNQKFHEGDLVQIAEDLGPHMKHFTAGVPAIVIGSYADQFGGSQTNTYTVYIKDKGTSSWYDEHQLTLIAKEQHSLLKDWERELEEKSKRNGDLDWIFASGPELVGNFKKRGFPGASVSALARCFGLNDLWGPSGEGIVHHENSMLTLAVAEKYLVTRDKNGWLKACEGLKELIDKFGWASVARAILDNHKTSVNKEQEIKP